MKSLYERMGDTYRQEGDYIVPNLVLPDTGYAGFEKQWTLVLETVRATASYAISNEAEFIRKVRETSMVRQEQLCRHRIKSRERNAAKRAKKIS